jgi:hypothetical protein
MAGFSKDTVVGEGAIMGPLTCARCAYGLAVLLLVVLVGLLVVVVVAEATLAVLLLLVLPSIAIAA